jgi:hypothetical protein
VYERVLPDPASLPSPVRRMLVVVVFLGVAFALFALASGMVLSAPCLAGGPCGDRDELIERGLGVVWIGASMWCIVAGWRGQLPGARRRRSRSTHPGA